MYSDARDSGQYQVSGCIYYVLRCGELQGCGNYQRSLTVLLLFGTLAVSAILSGAVAALAVGLRPSDSIAVQSSTYDLCIYIYTHLSVCIFSTYAFVCTSIQRPTGLGKERKTQTFLQRAILWQSKSCSAAAHGRQALADQYHQSLAPAKIMLQDDAVLHCRPRSKTVGLQ